MNEKSKPGIIPAGDRIATQTAFDATTKSPSLPVAKPAQQKDESVVSIKGAGAMSPIGPVTLCRFEDLANRENRRRARVSGSTDKKD